MPLPLLLNRRVVDALENTAMIPNKTKNNLAGITRIGLRKQIISLAPYEKANGAPRDFRSAVAACARDISSDLDYHWQRAKAQSSDGYVDVIDMFSGCGGMSAGFRAVNSLIPAYRAVLAVDIDPVANRSYAANLGLDPVTEDVSGLSRRPEKLKALLRSSGRRPGHPLVLIGCAPCQGFSSHRNRAGEGDKRNPLFVEFAKVAAILKPDAVVVENVPELLTTQYWPYVQKARQILEGSGYFVYVGVHNIAEFGVPQERFRALMLALPKPFAPPRGFLPREQFCTVRSAIGHLPTINAGEVSDADSMHYTAGHHPSTIQTIRAVPKDGGNRPANVGPQCLIRARERQGRGAYDDVYGRLWWDRPAITITAYARNPASGRFVHPSQDRGLSVREAALLQGFPSDFTFAGSLDERFRQIGNAVPPRFAAFLGVHVLGELLAAGGKGQDAQKGIEKPVGSSFSRLIPALKAGYRNEVCVLRDSRAEL